MKFPRKGFLVIPLPSLRNRLDQRAGMKYATTSLTWCFFQVPPPLSIKMKKMPTSQPHLLIHKSSSLREPLLRRSWPDVTGLAPAPPKVSEFLKWNMFLDKIWLHRPLLILYIRKPISEQPLRRQNFANTLSKPCTWDLTCRFRHMLCLYTSDCCWLMMQNFYFCQVTSRSYQLVNQRKYLGPSNILSKSVFLKLCAFR